jgi:hypothetical protein
MEGPYREASREDDDVDRHGRVGHSTWVWDREKDGHTREGDTQSRAHLDGVAHQSSWEVGVEANHTAAEASQQRKKEGEDQTCARDGLAAGELVSCCHEDPFGTWVKGTQRVTGRGVSRPFDFQSK